MTELGGRKEMSEWLLAHDLPTRDSTEKAYSTDANIWGRHPRGQDAGAPRHRRGDRGAHHGRAVLGPVGRDRRRGRHAIGFDQGRPVTVNGKEFASPSTW